ncbi:hypothetical protein LTR15_000032 [Elasticomyces elasticus]|nr:hypothetical protein LTR15_000032 [Elasticomyces elasticus]
MADHAPSRLLALPAELRVRIYECLFEDESPQPEIDISLVRDHAPKVAIVAVSRFIRREALELTERAVSRFFSNHKFIFDLHTITCKNNDGKNIPDLREAWSMMKTQPRFLSKTLELRFHIPDQLRRRTGGRQFVTSVKLEVTFMPEAGDYASTYQLRHDGDSEYTPPRKIKFYQAALQGRGQVRIALGQGRRPHRLVTYFSIEEAVKRFTDVFAGW